MLPRLMYAWKSFRARPLALPDYEIHAATTRLRYYSNL